MMSLVSTADLEDLQTEPLPSPWSYGVMWDGRVFFINEELHTTTWLHPLFSHPIQSGHFYNKDLPHGWEMNTLSSDIPYYIDHLNRVTTFQCPTNESPADNHRNLDRKLSRFRRSSSKRKSGKQKVIDKMASVKRDADAPVSFRGWLNRQEGTGPLKTWKRRWCVLANFCLFFYKGSEESQTLGSLLLPSFQINPCVKEEDGISKKFAFKAQHENVKTFYFFADSAEEMETWLEVMRAAANVQFQFVDGNSEFRFARSQSQNAIDHSAMRDSGFPSNSRVTEHELDYSRKQKSMPAGMDLVQDDSQDPKQRMTSQNQRTDESQLESGKLLYRQDTEAHDDPLPLNSNLWTHKMPYPRADAKNVSSSSEDDFMYMRDLNAQQLKQAKETDIKHVVGQSQTDQYQPNAAADLAKRLDESLYVGDRGKIRNMQNQYAQGESSNSSSNLIRYHHQLQPDGVSSAFSGTESGQKLSSPRMVVPSETNYNYPGQNNKRDFPISQGQSFEKKLLDGSRYDPSVSAEVPQNAGHSGTKNFEAKLLSEIQGQGFPNKLQYGEPHMKQVDINQPANNLGLTNQSDKLPKSSDMRTVQSGIYPGERRNESSTGSHGDEWSAKQMRQLREEKPLSRVEEWTLQQMKQQQQQQQRGSHDLDINSDERFYSDKTPDHHLQVKLDLEHKGRLESQDFIRPMEKHWRVEKPLENMTASIRHQTQALGPSNASQMHSPAQSNPAVNSNMFDVAKSSSHMQRNELNENHVQRSQAPAQDTQNLQHLGNHVKTRLQDNLSPNKKPETVMMIQQKSDPKLSPNEALTPSAGSWAEFDDITRLISDHKRLRMESTHMSSSQQSSMDQLIERLIKLRRSQTRLEESRYWLLGRIHQQLMITAKGVPSQGISSRILQDKLVEVEQEITSTISTVAELERKLTGQRSLELNNIRSPGPTVSNAEQIRKVDQQLGAFSDGSTGTAVSVSGASKSDVDLESKLQELHLTQKRLEQESIFVNNLREEKMKLEKALSRIQREEELERDQHQLIRLQRQKQATDNELYSLQKKLTYAVRNLEEIKAVNARLENEITSRRRQNYNAIKQNNPASHNSGTDITQPHQTYFRKDLDSSRSQNLVQSQDKARVENFPQANDRLGVDKSGFTGNNIASNFARKKEEVMAPFSTGTPMTNPNQVNFGGRSDIRESLRGEKAQNLPKEPLQINDGVRELNSSKEFGLHSSTKLEQLHEMERSLQQSENNTGLEVDNRKPLGRRQWANYQSMYAKDEEGIQSGRQQLSMGDQSRNNLMQRLLQENTSSFSVDEAGQLKGLGSSNLSGYKQQATAQGAMISKSTTSENIPVEQIVYSQPVGVGLGQKYAVGHGVSGLNPEKPPRLIDKSKHWQMEPDLNVKYMSPVMQDSGFRKEMMFNSSDGIMDTAGMRPRSKSLTKGTLDDENQITLSPDVDMRHRSASQGVASERDKSSPTDDFGPRDHIRRLSGFFTPKPFRGSGSGVRTAEETAQVGTSDEKSSVVYSKDHAFHPDRDYDQHIDEIFSAPQKIKIPELYDGASDDEIPSAEEALKRKEKAEKYRKMVAAQSLQEFSKGELTSQSGALQFRLQDERRRREQMLDTRQLLAEQVVRRSRQTNEAANKPRTLQDLLKDDDDGQYL